MARLVLKRSTVDQVLRPAALYVMGCIAALVLAYALGDAWLPALFIAGMVTIVVTWRAIRWQDPWARYFSFGAVLLLVCALDRVFYIADYFVNGVQFDAWPFPVQTPQVAVFKGEVIAVAGTLMVVLGWRICGGQHVSPSVVTEKPRESFRVLLIIYVASLAGMLVAHRSPRLAAMAGQLLPTLLGLGLVSTFLLPMARLRRDGARLVLTAALSIPFLLLASGTGMKENIILAVVPTAVMAWRYFRNPVARGVMIVGALVGLALITAYVNYYRTQVWIPESHGLAPRSQSILRDFLHKTETDGIAPTIGDGLSAFLARSDGSYTHGWAVSIADEQEYHPRLVFAPLAYTFVPRVLWPAKPRIITGILYSRIVEGPMYRITENSSSTAAGFYPALYLGAGWLAVVLGSLLAGALLASMTRLALAFGGSLTAGLYVFSMLPFMLRMNANWPNGVLAGPVISLCYVVALVAFARVVARITFHGRTSRATAP